MTTLLDIETPALLLEQDKLMKNLRSMNARAKALGVSLRPHLKTAKSADIARLVFDGATGPITVSTMREVSYFIDHGFTDIFLAVGVSPDKLRRLNQMASDSVTIKIAVDGQSMATALATEEPDPGAHIGAMIEIDCGDSRGGVSSDSEELLQIATTLDGSGLAIAGVFTHGGQSYDCVGIDAIREVAREEHHAIIHATERLRHAGFTCPHISLGSTPTATFAEAMDGVTEVRAGVYMFQDLQQQGLGVCALDELALSALATVIGLHTDRNVALVDAGGLALSKDRGASANEPDPGFGLVCTVDGDIIHNLHVVGVSQEHGKISTIDGTALPAHLLQPGTRVRILPNHACMMAAAHDHYNVIGHDQTITRWNRVNGW